MPKAPNGEKRVRLPLLAGLIGSIILMGLLNLFNVAMHPGASKFWLAAIAMSSILISIAISIIIWSRHAKRI